MFKEYFHFTRSERRGVLLLIIFILFFVTIPKFYGILIPKSNSIDTQEIAANLAKWDSLKPKEKHISVKLASFNPNLASKMELMQLGLSEKVANNLINFRNKGAKFYKKQDFKKVWGVTDSAYQVLEPYISLSLEEAENRNNQNKASRPKGQKIVQLFEFDPNTVSKSDLIKLGLTEKAANNLVNFRNKGAKFYKKQDFKKVWGVTDADYDRLEPYILTKNTFASKDVPKSYNQSTSKIDINTGTSEEFQKLRGIGKKTADRIIKFRTLLGGFHSIEQVGETWGLPKETFYNLKPQFILSKENSFQQININTASVDELKKHPYIKWREANTIIEYRKQHGHFKAISELQDIQNISGELFVKIEPYLKIE